MLCDGELLAVRDLFEQIRECGLRYFNGDCLHNETTVIRFPAQDQFFS
jgi:hypothetical protein